MLGNLIKDLWAVHKRPANEPPPATQTMVWPVKPLIEPRDSRLVVALSGPARSGAFLGPLHSLGTLFEKMGYRYRLVNFESTDWFSQLQSAMQEGVRCVVAPAGAGTKLFPEFSGCPWAASGVPFIKLLGDHPAYFPDRHRQDSVAHVNLYVYPDHLDFYERRVRVPTLSDGVGATMPVVGLISPDVDTSKISRQRNGRLAFYKNGNDPEALRRLWREALPTAVHALLNHAAEELRSGMSHQSDVRAIERAVDNVLRAMNISLLLPHDLLCFLNAQLDDYLRREKSTLIGRVLAKYPVDVFGDFWEHVDFSRGSAIWHGGGDYQKLMMTLPTYLAVVDMSPNAEGSVHERVTYAARLKTVCLTNATPFFSEHFPDMARYAFRFNEESIAQSVEHVLAYPDQTVEAGFAAATRYEQAFPEERYAKAIIDAADLVHARLTHPRVQNFCVWSGTEIGGGRPR